ncbi:hypothetical protein [Ruminococcus sp. NK3A76]|uniref:hypothetical protein n=1 Tax=Ruminococcus sp. NK3A76 TaxID=877411 RepID=UPI00048E4AAD|nr:hypothetical protein [Ruminococcus sp. NK3A76]
MKNIVNIIKLDHITVSSKTSVLVSTLLPLPFLIMGPQFGIIIYMMMFGNFYHGVFITGEKSGYGNLYGALPITKKELIAARFIETPLLCLIAGGLVTALGEISIRLGWSEYLLKSIHLEDLAVFFTKQSDIFAPVAVAGLCFVFSCYMSFLSLVDFKWGVAKEGPISVLFTFSCCALAWLIITITDIDVAEELKTLVTYHHTKIAVIFVIMGLVLEVIFAIVTYLLIRNDDLR